MKALDKILDWTTKPHCSHQNLSKAIQTGRLQRSIGWVRGRPVIADPELALRE